MKNWQLKLTPGARRNLRVLPVRERERIEGALDRLIEGCRRGDLQKLKGMEDMWRLRVGEYRVFLEYVSESLMIIVHRVAHRREVYRR